MPSWILSGPRTHMTPDLPAGNPNLSEHRAGIFHSGLLWCVNGYIELVQWQFYRNVFLLGSTNVSTTGTTVKKKNPLSQVTLSEHVPGRQTSLWRLLVRTWNRPASAKPAILSVWAPTSGTKMITFFLSNMASNIYGNYVVSGVLRVIALLDSSNNATKLREYLY